MQSVREPVVSEMEETVEKDRGYNEKVAVAV